MPRPIDSNDTYMPMLLKNMPSEIVAAYVALGAVLDAAGGPSWLTWIVFGVCLVIVPIWLCFGQKVKGWLQLSLATLAFIVWDMSLGSGAFQTIPGFKTYIGAAFLILFTMLIAPLVTKIAKPKA